MKKQSPTERDKELARLAALPDDQIDTSDIPELTEEQLQGMVRGKLFRPLKMPVTIRLDADLVAWLKEDGKGYQTKANALLRREMLRALRQGKRPKSEPVSTNPRKGKQKSR